jgi:8-oxo-dGTP pyrophosphatase MutT (NUDIX family)
LAHIKQVRSMEADLLADMPGAGGALGGRARWHSLAVAINADSLTSWFLPGVAALLKKQRLLLDITIDDQDHTWLVGQYRYTLDSYEWEIPEGGCPAGESPLEAARRELVEETGLVASDFRLLLDNIALSNSVTDERATIYVATGLIQTEASPEETEDLAVRRLPLADAIAMVRRGEITDSISVIALLALAAEKC